MRYMLILRATDATYAAYQDPRVLTEAMERVGRYNEEMLAAGVLVSAEGLAPEAGVVVDHSAEPPVVTDGPYGETKELFGGFWIVDVASPEEAVEWAKRAPLTGAGAKLEVRRVADPDERPDERHGARPGERPGEGGRAGEERAAQGASAPR